jgi:hypothetical protein
MHTATLGSTLCTFTLLLTAGCTDPAPGQPDAGATADGAVTADSGLADAAGDPSLLAKVFELDPLVTPTPRLVQLSGLADDTQGTLTSAADATGLRLLKVVSCVDEGATAAIPGAGIVRICTLRQRASRLTHGNFVFEDYKEGAASTFDPDDLFAEVSAYYHVKRIYDLITDKEVGLFDHLPVRHEAGGARVPLTVVVNHQQPGSAKLTPKGVASYIPREFGQLGLYTLNGLTGVEGDALILGQGERADFGYSGEVIYHEFGHMVFTALAGTYAYIYGDAQGLCHLSSALHEGVADTFAWLVSGRAKLGGYPDTESGGKGSYLRDADNQATFPEDIGGAYLHDGQIISGANHEVYQLLTNSAGITMKRFVRLLLRTYQALAPQKGKLTFRSYAETLMATLSAEGLGAHVGAVKEIMGRRGVLDETRAKPIDGFDGTDPAKQTLYTGGVGMGSTSLKIQDPVGGGTLAAAPAYVQTYVDLPAGKTKLTIEAGLVETMTGASSTAGLDYRIFRRAGSPVAYGIASSPVQVTCDEVHTPTVEQQTTPSGVASLARWTIEGLQGATRHYLHMVNYGTASGALVAIKVTY